MTPLDQFLKSCAARAEVHSEAFYVGASNADIPRLLQLITVMREALEFYAHKSHMTRSCTEYCEIKEPHQHLYQEDGTEAREALEKCSQICKERGE